jgi:hypothetical protein
MVPLFVFGIEMYHFCASYLQFEQIIDLESIDSVSDRWAPFVSVEVVETGGTLLTRTRSHLLVHLGLPQRSRSPNLQNVTDALKKLLGTSLTA